MINLQNLKGSELVAAVAYNAGFRGQNLIVAIAIAYAESSCKPDMVGDVKLQNDTWGPSIGLWQIRSLRHPEKYNGVDKLRIEEKLFDPQYNAYAAYQISKGGIDFHPWSTYTQGLYNKYEADAFAAVSRMPV